jgi:double-stranded uracil-DNA glycosylase
MNTLLTKNSLDPFISSTSRTLILGTAPGRLSLELRRYYASPNNSFWSILERIYDEGIGQAYEAKLAFLENNHLALWDVLKAFEREGSLGSSFKQITCNDFSPFLKSHPSIRYIAFNCSKAQKMFKRYVQQNIGENGQHIKYIILPSTSSTPGRYVKSFDKKVQEWAVLKNLL